MQPFLEIQVENIWSFLKTAGVITLLQATNYKLDEVQLISHHPGNQENGGEALSVLSFVFQKLIIITQTTKRHVSWACCSVFCHSFEFPSEIMKKAV